MDKKKNNTVWSAVLASVIILVLVAGVIGLSIWMEKRKDSGGQDGKQNQKAEQVASSASVGAVDVEATDGDFIDYEQKGFLKLAEYKGIEVDTEPTEDDILLELESSLQKMRKEHKGENIKKGDYICIDYQGYVHGEEYEDLSEEDVVLHVGEYEYGEAFEKHLIGKLPGDKVKFEMTYDDDYEELSGEKVKFRVTINGRFDDYYAKKFSKGKYETVEQYLESVKEKVKKENEKLSGDTAWDILTEECEVTEYPKGRVEEETDIARRQYEDMAGMLGYESGTEVMEAYGMDEDSLVEIAEDTVKGRMIANTIAVKEHLSMDDNTYKSYLMNIMEKDEEETQEALEEEYKRDYSNYPKDDMLIELVKDYLGSQAVLK